MIREKSCCGVGLSFLLAICVVPSLALGATGIQTDCLNDGDFLKCARGSTVIPANPAGMASYQQPKPQRNYIAYSGLPKWPDSTYRWFYNPNNQPATFSTESMLATIGNYMAKWSAVCGIRFEYLGISQATPSSAGPNMIGWSYANDYDGYTSYSYSGTGDLVSFIVIDPNRVTQSYQIGGLMNHELGHVIGLDHSDVAASIMYANPYHTYYYQETLNDDDIKGCVSLYGLPGAQSINFITVPSITVGNTGVINATGGASGNAVTFTSTTPTICTVAASTVTGVSVGNCVIAANQAGNANYTVAPQATQTIAISAGAQSVSFGLAPTLVVGGSGTLTAAGGASGNPVTFTSTTPMICTVDASTVMALSTGNCVVAANQSGGANYSAAAQTTQTITVGNASLDILKGWNLLGNGMNQPLAVTHLLGDALNVTSVWKWDVASTGWQFYAPSMDAATLQTYASGKGYGVLSTINPGEGFWVNALQSFATTLPGGTTISGLDFQSGSSYALTPGWNLVAIGDAFTPSAFNVGLSAVPPTAGVVPINLTSLWAWDNPLSKWYFYAPNLDGQGGTALVDYITSKGYLDFTANSKKLGPGVGFWVNRP